MYLETYKDVGLDVALLDTKINMCNFNFVIR